MNPDNNDKSKELKKKTISSMIWNMGERVFTQAFSFIIGIILARMLCPDDYGYIVIASTCIDVAKSLIETGLGDAYIQQKKADETYATTLLIFMLGISLVVYLILFLAAPLFAHIYRFDMLVMIIRIYGLSLPLCAVRTILIAIMQKALKFKILFFSSLMGTIVGGIVGICMAMQGLGVWALVAYFLVDTSVDMIFMAILLKWIPRGGFSIKKLKEMYSFAAYSFGRNMINQYSNQLLTLFIGKRYTPADLSFYNRGKQYPFLIGNTVNSVLSSTMFPVMAQISDDEESYKRALKRLLTINLYIQIPLLMGFAMVSEPIVRLLLTDKWLGCVKYLQVTCISFSLWPYVMTCRRALEAKGYIKVVFKNEIIVTIFRIIFCFSALFVSPFAVAMADLLVWVTDSVIHSISLKKWLKYGFLEQIKDVIKTFVSVLLMIIVVYFFGNFVNNIYLKLFIEIIIGIVIYIVLSLIMKNDSFYYILGMLKSRKSKKML